MGIILLSAQLILALTMVYHEPILRNITWLVSLIVGFGWLYFGIRQDFLLPFHALQSWIVRYQTDADARLDQVQKSTFQPVASAINHLIDENQYLYDDMEAILKTQVKRLSKKSASLETLYSVSSKLNTLHSAEELFTHFLGIFVNMTHACSGVARALTADGKLQLVASQGVLNPQAQVFEVNCADCICGKIALDLDSGVQFSVHTCDKCIGKQALECARVGTIFIPLKYHGKALGVFNLFFDQAPSLSFDERALLASIADNIAIALDKARLDQQTKRMELSQERLFLSQEIHDSLAQTIYSLKLQVRVLDDIIQQGNTQAARQKMLNLHASITQANQELRELMGNFRVSLDARGIEDSLRNLANSFRMETGITTYFQVKGRLNIAPEVEVQIMRITQEALSNIRKHAKARTVRILLFAEPECQLLIEDDGVGFQENHHLGEAMGNNIGLNIMRERVQIIGARLEIESEIDEGTRIVVNFSKTL